VWALGASALPAALRTLLGGRVQVALAAACRGVQAAVEGLWPAASAEARALHHVFVTVAAQEPHQLLLLWPGPAARVAACVHV
jgi:hypothetical protein